MLNVSIESTVLFEERKIKLLSVFFAKQLLSVIAFLSLISCPKKKEAILSLPPNLKLPVISVESYRQTGFMILIMTSPFY